MSSEKKIFTLKQVVQSIQKTIEERYQNSYWVKAEMHKINRYPSGHAFPELVQKEDGKIVAQINGTIWKQNLERINDAFIHVVKEPLQEGKILLLLVKVNYHPNFGLSLHINDIDPSFSLGELQREREETLKKLVQLNLINLNQQRSFPLIPKRIAVISGDASKGLSDFIQVLHANPFGYHFEMSFFDTYVQGDLAVQSIIHSLSQIEKDKDHFDLVVIVRGGGAEVGMTCYNHFDLCKAIATFPIPVLTGIGHSTNLTVAEMVAYRNAITPTKLAEFLVHTFREFELELNNFQQKIKRAAEKLPQEQLLLLNNLGNGVLQKVNKRLHNIKAGFYQYQFGLQQHALAHLSKENKKYDQLIFKFQSDLKFLVEMKNQQLNHVSNQLNFLDPIHVLKRGYSIARINGKVIDQQTEISLNDLIETETIQGVIESKVSKTPQINVSESSSQEHK